MKIAVFEHDTVCGTEYTLEGLERFGTVVLCPGRDIAGEIGDAEIVLVNKTLLTKDVIDHAGNLRYIGVMATGVNNVDLAAARKRGIAVTNVPGYSTDSVAQLTLAFLLEFATNLSSYTASTARGDWTRSKRFAYFPYPITLLSGKTLGVVGMGAIGTKVASVAAALSMRVIYYSRSKKDLPYEYLPLETVFRESDYLSLHCPLTEDTRGLVNKNTLSIMKDGAFLINTCRGPVIDQEDVAGALKNGKLGGYAADVLAVEPQRPDCPLIGCPNVLLTPHVAWAARETRGRLLEVLLSNLDAFLQGKRQNRVE